MFLIKFCTRIRNRQQSNISFLPIILLSTEERGYETIETTFAGNYGCQFTYI